MSSPEHAVWGKLGKFNETYEALRPSNMIFAFCDRMPRKEESDTESDIEALLHSNKEIVCFSHPVHAGLPGHAKEELWLMHHFAF